MEYCRVMTPVRTRGTIHKHFVFLAILTSSYSSGRNKYGIQVTAMCIRDGFRVVVLQVRIAIGKETKEIIKTQGSPR